MKFAKIAVLVAAVFSISAAQAYSYADGGVSSSVSGGSNVGALATNNGSSSQYTSNYGSSYAGAAATVDWNGVGVTTSGGSDSYNSVDSYKHGHATGSAAGGVSTDYSASGSGYFSVPSYYYYGW